MAVSDVSITDVMDDVLSTTLRHYKKKLEDNIFGSLPLYYWLQQGGRKRTQNGGLYIVVPVLYGENTTITEYSDYDLLDITPQKGITTAKFDWKQLAVSISMSRKDRRLNSGEHQLIDLFRAKVMQAEKSIQWFLNDTLHGIHGNRGVTFCSGDSCSVDSHGGSAVDSTDGTSKSINSLDHLVRSAYGQCGNPDSTDAVTHEVGKISVTTNTSAAGANTYDWDSWAWSQYVNPWWMNMTIPGFERIQRGAVGGVPGPRQPSGVLVAAGDYDGNSYQNLVSAMRTMNNLLTDGNDRPDLILCGRHLFEAYEACLMPLERFTDTKLGDAGFMNLQFKQCKMMLDHGITTGVHATPSTTDLTAPMYFLNSKYLELVVDAKTDFITTPFVRPENQDASTAQILWMGNLCISNRSKQGVISFANVGSGGYVT